MTFSSEVMIRQAVSAGRLRSVVPPLYSLRFFHEKSEKLALKISDPMMLVNNVANRYLSLSRIIVEFVDNSIDDMEGYYEPKNNSYTREFIIDVHINQKENYVRIVDNANGMNADTLTRLVCNIGESSKYTEKSTATTNGRFGFGIQSFRAGAHKLHIKSCQGGENDDIYELSLSRDQASEIDPPSAISRDEYGKFPGGYKSGTDIIIGDWVDNWLTSHGGAKQLCEDLTQHFDRLLHRGNFKLTVLDDKTGLSLTCNPTDYDSFNIAASDGQDHIIKRVYLAGKYKEDFVDVNVMVLPQQNVTPLPVNFFCNGRRVSSVRYLKSFVTKSKRSWVWNHPNVVGYIETSCLTPVITRDEFKRNAIRKKVYDILHEIEIDLSKKLDDNSIKYYRSDETFQRLEGAINTALSSVVREKKRKSIGEEMVNTTLISDERNDASFEADDAVPDSEENVNETASISDNECSPSTSKKETQQADKSIARGVGLGVKFVSSLENNRRAKLAGKYIEIDVTHPDFQARITSKNGNPHLTERLLGYIANVVSAAYRSNVHADFVSSTSLPPATHDNNLSSDTTGSKVYDEMLDSIVESSTKLEEKLQKRLPALQKEINGLLHKGSNVTSNYK